MNKKLNKKNSESFVVGLSEFGEDFSSCALRDYSNIQLEKVQGEPTQSLNDVKNLQIIEKELNMRFVPKRKQSDYLSFAYRFLDLEKRADRVATCGTLLGFDLFEHKLVKANFCKDRLCPMCNWRRSLKLFGQVSAVMDVLENQGFQFLFLTFTVKNCFAYDLPNTIDVLLRGFRKLTLKSKVKNIICGSFRTLEITRNSNDGTYHPHLHIIVAVKKSYFKGRYYLKTSEWAEIWRNCVNVDYLPIVDVRRVKNDNNGISGAVKEVRKYSVKGSDFLDFDDMILTCNVVSDFLSALSNRQLCAFTGCFSDVRKKLKLDDIENGDLLVTDVNEELREDLKKVIVFYGWKNGCYTLLDI